MTPMHRSQSGVPTALLLLAPLALAIVFDFFSLRLSEPMWLQVVSAVLLISLFPLGAWATYRSLAATQASSAFHLSAPWRQLATVVKHGPGAISADSHQSSTIGGRVGR